MKDATGTPLIAGVDGSLGTPGRIIKVNHAGEFGAINIYRAQILVARLFGLGHVRMLEEFLQHEQRHLQVFGEVLSRRRIPRCRSFWFCGIGGYLLGLLTALFGRKGVMACTAAVETVVTRHLEAQLDVLGRLPDEEAYAAVQSILADEEEHRDAAIQDGFGSILYRPIYSIVAISTEAVIWLGMRL
jgi:ubiquinone biosynthesis monooxygenase Coq7